MAPPSMTLSLEEIFVLNNGRPAEAPRAMDLGLAVQLRNPLTPDGEPLDSDLLSFRSGAGQSIISSALNPAANGRPFFGKSVKIPALALVDIRFLVYYQNDLGPIVGAALNKIVDFVTGKIPYLPSEAKKHLHFKIDNTIAEEYGRQTLLVKVPEAEDEEHDLMIELLAPETIRGVYMKPATGTSAPVVSKPVTFINENDVAARLHLRLSVSTGLETKPGPIPAKPPAKKTAAKGRSRRS